MAQNLTCNDDPNHLVNNVVLVHARTEAYLATVEAADLEQAIEVPWIIWHVMEHEIHHRGEIFLMLGLLSLEAPDI